jgi:hypothetical protein
MPRRAQNLATGVRASGPAADAFLPTCCICLARLDRQPRSSLSRHPASPCFPHQHAGQPAVAGGCARRVRRNRVDASSGGSGSGRRPDTSASRRHRIVAAVKRASAGSIGSAPGTTESTAVPPTAPFTPHRKPMRSTPRFLERLEGHSSWDGDRRVHVELLPGWGGRRRPVPGMCSRPLAHAGGVAGGGWALFATAMSPEMSSYPLRMTEALMWKESPVEECSTSAGTCRLCPSQRFRPPLSVTRRATAGPCKLPRARRRNGPEQPWTDLGSILDR